MFHTPPAGSFPYEKTLTCRAGVVLLKDNMDCHIHLSLGRLLVLYGILKCSSIEHTAVLTLMLLKGIRRHCGVEGSRAGVLFFGAFWGLTLTASL